jgi:hypothetical protein
LDLFLVPLLIHGPLIKWIFGQDSQLSATT